MNTTKKLAESQPIDNSEYAEATAHFACLTPEDFALVLDVIPAIGSALSWPKLAGEFLADVVRMLAGRECVVKLTHGEFGRRLWPDNTEAASVRKLSRVFNCLDRAQSLSGFSAVRLKVGTKFTVRDRTVWTDTAYQMGEFSAVMREIQLQAIKIDIGKFKGIERRARLLTIVQSVLNARGYQRIPVRARQTPKKSATATEESGAVEMKGRVTKDDVERDLDRIAEMLFENQQRWMNLGLRLPDWVKKVDAICESVELRGRAAVARSNKPALKLVGGQPK